MIEILRQKFSEQLHHLEPLFAEHEQENKILSLPPITPDIERIKAMEEIGIIHTIILYKDGVAIGFAMLILSPMLKYSTTNAFVETLFVQKEHRRFGNGLYLLDELELLAKELDVTHLFISSPIEGRLSKVLSKRNGYKQSSITHYKEFEKDAKGLRY